MEKINKRKFKKMLKEATSIPLFFDEVNQTTPEVLNTLYEITHRKVSHQKLYNYIPYKYGKHAMKGGK